MLLLGRMTGLAQSHEKSFLKRYDLSTTVINPVTAPTDEIYSWWTETAKRNGSIMAMNLWMTVGCTVRSRWVSGATTSNVSISTSTRCIKSPQRSIR